VASRNIHVLFVHGVGTHSHLSSLLQAYQAFRSNVRSPESPIPFEDPIPDWRLEAFDEGASPPYLKLAPRYPGVQPGPREGVYLYEVNYSALAGVVRKNQPLDITRLFVGFDLAVNFARARLVDETPAPLAPDAMQLDHRALALQVQRIAGVMVAATVPVLGLPSRLLRRYTETAVATITRFFEDIATFAMDKNGEQLISAHVERTMQNIVESARFREADAGFERDGLVVIAHSLGTVVTHSYLVRHWALGEREVPSRVLTFGSPIALVCWLWLFLDFPRLEFDPDHAPGDSYFCWTPQASAGGPYRAIEWINVVNHLDPIATAFPPDYIDLAAPVAANASRLAGREIRQRYIKTGGMLAAGATHTQYFDDREGFLEIVGRLAGVRPGDPAEPCTERPAELHWREAIRDLWWLRILAWALGAATIGAYLAVISLALGTPWPLALLPLYLVPQLTIGGLAFFQRFFFGWPTKRTSVERILELPWRDWAAFPYRLRRAVGLSRIDPEPLAPAPGWFFNLVTGVIAFLPSAATMALPVALGWLLGTEPADPLELVWQNLIVSTLMLAGFVGYLVLFTLSEFAKHWRAVISLTTSGRREHVDDAAR
jgi:hypothetical protein